MIDRFEEVGFTLETAEMISSELKKMGLIPNDVIDRSAVQLMAYIEEHGSLENAMAILSGQENKLERDIIALKSREEETQKSIEKFQSRDHINAEMR